MLGQGWGWGAEIQRNAQEWREKTETGDIGEIEGEKRG